VDIIRADLRVHDDLSSAFNDIDAVIHLAAATSGNEDTQFASTVVATEKFLSAMALSPVKRLVHVSSLVVYDWSQARTVMNEETPLERDIYDMGAYTIAKVWQERIVLRTSNQHQWTLTVLRPGFIWGPEHTEIAGMGRRVGPFQLMFGPFTRLPLCYVMNCADAIVMSLESPAAVGETFNLIDGDEVRVWRYSKMVRRNGRARIPLPLPYILGLGVAKFASLVSRMLFGKKGKLPSLLTPRRFQSQFKPLRFSNEKLRKQLGWAPPLEFIECIRITNASDGSLGKGSQ
jgi:UDP-glucose 4-epimerase